MGCGLWVVGYRILDAGCSLLDARYSMLDARYSMLDARCSMLDTGCSILDARYKASVIGCFGTKSITGLGMIKSVWG
jgi:hypothetical protein